jgi:uncharacterized LabA/DUF88 family protein
MGTPERIILFVDGENLVCRFQAMEKEGYLRRNDIAHVPDEFVWGKLLLENPLEPNLIRVTYYTSATGSEDCLNNLRKTIHETRYVCRRDRDCSDNFVFPLVFRKANREARSRLVDIRLTIDVLTHVDNDDIDCVWLITGDGDYIPLIEAVMRRGKKVHLGALTSGLNKKLPDSVDKFSCLDGVFFEKDPNGKPITGQHYRFT